MGLGMQRNKENASYFAHPYIKAKIKQEWTKIKLWKI